MVCVGKGVSGRPDNQVDKLGELMRKNNDDLVIYLLTLLAWVVLTVLVGVSSAK